MDHKYKSNQVLTYKISLGKELSLSSQGLSHRLVRSQLRPPGTIKTPDTFLCFYPLQGGDDCREKLFADNRHMLCVDSPAFTEIRVLARA